MNTTHEQLARALEIEYSGMSRRDWYFLDKLARCCLARWLNNRDLAPCQFCLRDLWRLGIEWEFPDGQVIQGDRVLKV